MSIFVKVCGITNEEDALLAVAMGADALGFVFAASPRQVQPPVVADIIKRLPPEIMTVGVFRDAGPARVFDVVNSTGLLGAQLSGYEPPAVTRRIAERVRYVIKGFSASDPALDKAADHGAYAVLMDAPTPGSGLLFDWSLTDRVPPGTRLLLAGGLNARNVADAIAATQPWGVDVSTGVEFVSRPGHKDPVKLQAFIAAAKAASVEEPSWMNGPADGGVGPADGGGGPDGAAGRRPFDWQNDS